MLYAVEWKHKFISVNMAFITKRMQQCTQLDQPVPVRSSTSQCSSEYCLSFYSCSVTVVPKRNSAILATEVEDEINQKKGTSAIFLSKDHMTTTAIFNYSKFQARSHKSKSAYKIRHFFPSICLSASSSLQSLSSLTD